MHLSVIIVRIRYKNGHDHTLIVPHSWMQELTEFSLFKDGGLMLFESEVR